MNHFMLARNPGASEIGRYGDTSTDRIVRTLFSGDPDSSHYHARIYGGAAVAGHHLDAGGGIGERNIQVAREVLRAHSIRVIEEDVGGQRGRKLDFWTDQDRTHCRFIQQETQARTATRRAKPVRVLIVDDSAVARKVIRAGLSEAGIEVIGEAGNAFDARELLLRDKPDVMTLDLEMPRLDGLTFLRKLTQYYPIPVVVVSSSAPSGSAKASEVLKAGAQSVVDKADLDMSASRNNVARILVPRVKLAGLARAGEPSGS